MKIAVLGADSAIGQSLLGLIDERGYDALALPLEQCFPGLAEAQQLIESFAPDFLINAVQVHRLEVERELTVQDEQWLQSVIDLCRTSDRALLHCSSSWVFDGNNEALFSEDADVDERDALSKSLRRCEQLVAEGMSQGVIVRNAWLFGPCRDGGVFSGLLAQLESGGEVPLPSIVRAAPTPTGDAAKAIVSILEQLSCGADCWGVYHYCSSDLATVHEFAQAVVALVSQYGQFSPDHVTVVLDDEVDWPQFAKLNCDRIRDHFGIKQKPWRSSLTAIIKEIYSEQTA